MPFKETDRVEQRQALVEAWKSGTYCVADLARKFEVSRPTVYLWIGRHQANESLSDRSRAPHETPHRTDQHPELLEKVFTGVVFVDGIEVKTQQDGVAA